MKAYYTSIVPGVTLSVNIEELPRRDQVALMHHLMQATGITELLYTKMNLFPAQKQTLDKLWAQTTEAYIKGDPAQKGK